MAMAMAMARARARARAACLGAGRTEGRASSYPGTARTGHPRSVVTHVT